MSLFRRKSSFTFSSSLFILFIFLVIYPTWIQCGFEKNNPYKNLFQGFFPSFSSSSNNQKPSLMERKSPEREFQDLLLPLDGSQRIIKEDAHRLKVLQNGGGEQEGEAYEFGNGEDKLKTNKIHRKSGGTRSFLESTPFPRVHLHCDPLVNFKILQRLKVLGACVTLGLDYLSDISQWRTHCAIEDAFLRGRFSLRGSELGWAKSWLVNLGLGEENSAKFKLRLGLNLKNWKFYGKLRFRTEPISPFDIGDGLSCAGKLPLPLYLLPGFKSIPLRMEYRLRVNAGRSAESLSSSSNHHQRSSTFLDKKVQMTTGLGTIDVSLDELNFCLEYDEYAPLWGINLVRNEPNRKYFEKQLQDK